MDSSSPTLMAYPSVATGSGARILVINAVPGSSMSIRLEAPRNGGEVGGLEYQEGTPVNLSPDVYNIDAWPTGTADTMRLDRVTIPGGRPFVVIYPNPEGTLPWSVAVF